jgi:hypothetical protein
MLSMSKYECMSITEQILINNRSYFVKQTICL